MWQQQQQATVPVADMRQTTAIVVNKEVQTCEYGYVNDFIALQAAAVEQNSKQHILTRSNCVLYLDESCHRACYGVAKHLLDSSLNTCLLAQQEAVLL